jgi:hypothetical protein
VTHVDDAPFFKRLPGNHHRRVSAISSVLLVLILAACRSSLPAKFVEQAEQGVTLTTLTASPQEYRDKVVILGGVLVKEKENGGQVWLRLKNRPLDPQYHPHRPTSLDGPEAGHFWVTTSNPQQLPPQYRKWARGDGMSPARMTTPGKHRLILPMFRRSPKGFTENSKRSDLRLVFSAFLPSPISYLFHTFQGLRDL